MSDLIPRPERRAEPTASPDALSGRSVPSRALRATPAELVGAALEPVGQLEDETPWWEDERILEGDDRHLPDEPWEELAAHDELAELAWTDEPSDGDGSTRPRPVLRFDVIDGETVICVLQADLAWESEARHELGRHLDERWTNLRRLGEELVRSQPAAAFGVHPAAARRAIHRTSQTALAEAIAERTGAMFDRTFLSRVKDAEVLLPSGAAPLALFLGKGSNDAVDRTEALVRAWQLHRDRRPVEEVRTALTGLGDRQRSNYIRSFDTIAEHRAELAALLQQHPTEAQLRSVVELAWRPLRPVSLYTELLAGTFALDPEDP